jgi:uncharacterized FlaG/YvyC family protein
MEYGAIPKLDQFTDNRALNIQKVQSSKESSGIANKDDLNQVSKETSIESKNVSKVGEVSTQSSSQAKYEVVLTNTNFGYNDSSKDFYVKAVRGNSENQYPTENMMRIKSFIMSQANTAS